MKTDVQWMVQLVGNNGAEKCAVVRAIQADALRHAASLIGLRSVHRERLVAEAEKLEAQPERPQ